MSHLSNILSLATTVLKDGEDAVLATVVNTEGSAYRKTGAMMLICQDGRHVGMISGGCLEPYIVKRAFWLTRKGASVQVYQTGDESEGRETGSFEDTLDKDIHINNDSINFGLGCNGRIHVLFERLQSVAQLIKTIENVRLTQSSANIATLVRSTQLTGYIGMHVNLDAFLQSNRIECLNDMQATTNDSRLLEESPAIQHALNQLCQADLSIDKTAYVSLQHSDSDIDHTTQTQWLVRQFMPQKRLLICGAGNDVIPLVSLAKMQDWHVTVIDSRAHYATRTRFTEADVVQCVHTDDEETLLSLSENAAVAVMSHSLTQDKARLRVLLTNPPLYLGQLGPKYRTERLIEEIKASHGQGSECQKIEQSVRKLYYPIGYKLGGDGAEALALGIMAQISAVMNHLDSQALSKTIEQDIKVSKIATNYQSSRRISCRDDSDFIVS